MGMCGWDGERGGGGEARILYQKSVEFHLQQKEIIMFLLPFWYHQTVDFLSHFVCCSKGHAREQGRRTQFRFVKLFESTLLMKF